MKNLELILTIFAGINVVVVPILGFILNNIIKIRERLTRLETLMNKEAHE